ncbi:uncharacterized protein LOC127857812 [Dreissena polymorpha]|uniref:Protein sleepless n=1 Tax=Dreissena polymorpha TaxID=45954 RepID=A0A9D3Z285_DREPO|nr:uncharacterized protein LOC127857811 isoform X1 [Dreissena polymorpha]XP_052250444.1 uncharacterized protein LOC127857812 [Dreissena polymorpha]KAH3709296.1 hypothetical protein DPMN_068758 [Dreissena polymorpha]KAH3709300.1 hypothetical protein DPMN_068762 [Dreissena polymorpha]
MVGKITFVFAGVIAVLLCAAGTDALKCYVCSSLTDANCADTFKADGINTQSDSSCTACQKIKAGDAVSRACGVGSDGCTEIEVLGVKTATCTCSSDLCNAAYHVTVSLAMILFGILATLL